MPESSHGTKPGTALTSVLGTRYPVIQGPFGGGLSTAELTVAVSEAGGLGSYGVHAMAPDRIGPLVDRIRAGTSAPFSVNLWIPRAEEERPVPDTATLTTHTDRLAAHYSGFGLTPPDLDTVNARVDFDAQVDAVLAARPPVISVVMGVPPQRLVQGARRIGAPIVGTATTVAEARALQEAGCDVVVASGSDAGGHRGSFLAPVRESLVGTFSLVPQVSDAVTVPVVAAGGIADGRGVAAALTLGADGVQVGTGFLRTEESGASPVHRTALASERAETTVLTRLFSGRPARGIANDLVRAMADAEDRVPPYPAQNNLMLPIRTKAAELGRPDLLNLWSGQSALLASGGAAGDYLAALVAGAEKALGAPL
ncbi:nitronate monooxygenase [Nocardiopsis sp. EMB25]|uniref:NAD(P)H-dependent flavin oxidoreductase n=1 Tax=Nocardiopsis sp. EMB25 TaxID=2835867 RepID=UPI0022846484|nr:nitronate monooxygenase [Nocardiopsis sp. EMB25]MCY9787907.1 nitronate monooxygenase [Nocardiopsis sp. EMB25]